MDEIAVAVGSAEAAAVDAAAGADSLVSRNGGIHRFSRSKDRKKLINFPPVQKFLEPHWGTIGALGVRPRSCGLVVPAFQPYNHRHPLHAPGHEPPMKFKLGSTSLILHQNIA